jgi:hypothetical protein
MASAWRWYVTSASEAEDRAARHDGEPPDCRAAGNPDSSGASRRIQDICATMAFVKSNHSGHHHRRELEPWC